MATSKGRGRKHRAKNADDEIKAIVGEFAQVGGVAFLKPDVRQPEFARAVIASRYEIARDIDAQHIRTQFGGGNSGRSVAAAKVQYLEPFGYAEFCDQAFAAVAHARSDAREVAFFPECLVRIHWDTLHGLTFQAHILSFA